MFKKLDQTVRSAQASLALFTFDTAQPCSPVQADTVLAGKWLKAKVDFGNNGMVAFKAMYDSSSNQLITGRVLWFRTGVSDNDTIVVSPSNIIQFRFNHELASGHAYERPWADTNALLIHLQMFLDSLGGVSERKQQLQEQCV